MEGYNPIYLNIVGWAKHGNRVGIFGEDHGHISGVSCEFGHGANMGYPSGATCLARGCGIIHKNDGNYLQ